MASRMAGVLSIGVNNIIQHHRLFSFRDCPTGLRQVLVINLVFTIQNLRWSTFGVQIQLPDSPGPDPDPVAVALIAGDEE